MHVLTQFIYFLLTLVLCCSAHWCPPCRGFTPKLVEWLGNFKQHSAHAADFDVVFVSSDRDEHAFDEYYAEMKGFHALPYGERALKDSLSSKFGVSGIPTFVRACACCRRRERSSNFFSLPFFFLPS